MANIFITSDTHFGHANLLGITHTDETPLRPFKSVEEMDETLVENWNKVVQPQDKIYHLGDVAIHKRCLSILERLNGHKRLIRGNHDVYKTKIYLKYFEEIMAYRVFKDAHGQNFIMSHIPIYAEGLTRFKMNVHGHLHRNVIDDPRYLNVCVEQTNYTPVSLEEVRIMIENKRNKYN